MGKEFISYEQALALKKLGFDEPCLSYYKNDTLSDFFEIVKNSEISAPLKQQVFRWFREKYGYCVSIRKRYYHDAEVEYNYFIYAPNSNEHLEHNLLDEYESWEEAEIACINDLIKLVKTQ